MTHRLRRISLTPRFLCIIIILLGGARATLATELFLPRLAREGDAIILRQPDAKSRIRCIVVDGGHASEAPRLRKAIADCGCSHVDLWIVTHWDADHGGALERILADDFQFRRRVIGDSISVRGPPFVRQILEPGHQIPIGKGLPIRVRALALDSNITLHLNAEAPRTRELLRKLGIQALRGPSELAKASNDTSLVLVGRDSDGGPPYLLMSDVSSWVYHRYIAPWLPSQVQFVTATHHGGTTFQPDLNRRVNPGRMFILANVGNRNGHPVLEQLRRTALPYAAHPEYERDLADRKFYSWKYDAAGYRIDSMEHKIREEARRAVEFRPRIEIP